jgi:uncharacterized membrane protein YeaQ/YmgE (transglycosylase-associated protein family)
VVHLLVELAELTPASSAATNASTEAATGRRSKRRPLAERVPAFGLPSGLKIMQGMVMPSRALIWVAILIGSTIGGAIPELWGAEMLSFTSLLLSGIGALVGLWIVFKT